MRRLTLHLLAQTAAALAVALLLLCGLTWAFQALRLGHHLAGALEPTLVGRLLLLSAPTLLSLTVPLGLAAAVLFTLGQWHESGELEAALALGASPLQLATPALLLALLSAGATFAAASLETRALLALRRDLAGALSRTLVTGLRPGEFHELGPDTVFYTGRRLPSGHGEVLIAHGSQWLITAREATLRSTQDAVQLRLRDGELHLGHGDTALTRVRFGVLQQALPLAERLQRHFGFLEPQRRRSAPAVAAITTLALGLLAAAVGLWVRRRLPMVVVGLGGAVVVQLGCWAAGGLALPATVACFGGGWVLWVGRGRSLEANAVDGDSP